MSMTREKLAVATPQEAAAECIWVPSLFGAPVGLIVFGEAFAGVTPTDEQLHKMRKAMARLLEDRGKKRRPIE